MNNKVTIIGAGSVGATIAYTLVVNSPVSEIVLIDVNQEKVLGEVLDIKQATPFLSPTKVYVGDYKDAVDSDIVVITCGVARQPGQSRIDLAQTNVDVIVELAPKLVKYAPNAIYIIVSNPVDVLTYVFGKVTGLPKRQIIGSGTILDTIRLRTRLSELYSINQKQVHAYVLGEHGDTSFVAWSMADITGIPITEYGAALTNNTDLPLTPYKREDVEEYVRKSGGKIIAGKGATYYGIAASVCYIIKGLYSGADTVMTVSTLLDGEYGISDVCLSTLCVLSDSGILTTLTPRLSEDELTKLHNSAAVLKGVIEKVKF
ncbi:MAG: L-lactate dehydrogenase [Clostridia bacterium]|nr:L-lactate dehydrogenase [Clostridia bacterium]